jgi:hypothetical protein
MSVARNVLKIVGNDPELGTKAMETVLRQKNVSKETAEVAASQLQIAKSELVQQEEAKRDTTEKQKQGPMPSFHDLPGYSSSEIPGYQPLPFDTFAESGTGREGSFVEGRDVIPDGYIKNLLANKHDQATKDFFDQTYGQGAAAHFIDQDSRMSSSSAVNQPPVVAAEPPPSDFAFPLPTPAIDENTDTSATSMEF